ncbi:MAG: AAA family ATPase [Xanthobacteraceae bacterium]
MRTYSATPEWPALRDAASWDGEAVPERRWLVRDRIPLGAVSLLGGDGGTGKTSIALQLAVATSLEADWLGKDVEAPGPVIFLSGEEDEDEVHRRLGAILSAQGRGFRDLRGLYLLCVTEREATLAAADRSGLVKPTALYDHLLDHAARIEPSLIVIESSADVFAGDENDRGQVKQFVNLLRHLTRPSDAAVLLINHPSLTGLSSGSGTSGSTSWNNSVRSRLYFSQRVDKEQPDRDLRELKIMKANYGPAGEVIQLRWQHGVFVAADGAPAPEKIAAQSVVDETFLRILDKRIAQGRPARPWSGRGYAPAEFAKDPEAGGIRRQAFEAAMNRLLDAGCISIIETGPPSARRAHIERTQGGLDV